MEIQRIVKDCYKWLYTNKLNNLKEVDKFLEKKKIQPTKTKSLNRKSEHTGNKETELIIKNLTAKKAQDQVILLVNFTKHLMENECQYLLNPSRILNR